MKNDLIRLVLDWLLSDDGPELYDAEGQPLDEGALLELAQGLADAIAAPRLDTPQAPA